VHSDGTVDMLISCGMPMVQSDVIKVCMSVMKQSVSVHAEWKECEWAVFRNMIA
jgi:hypothetical protein